MAMATAAYRSATRPVAHSATRVDWRATCEPKGGGHVLAKR